MNTTQYAEWVWMLDAGLLAAVMLLMAGGLLHTVLGAARRRRSAPGENALHQFCQSLEGLDPALMGGHLAALEARLTPTQWIWLVNQHEAVVPASVWPHLERHLRASRVVAELERRAVATKHKWRRIEAMLCIGRVASPQAVAQLERGLAEQDEDLRYFAVLALAQLRTPAAAQALLAFLRRGELSGHKIVAGLEAFPPSILPAVYQALERSDPRTRFWLLKLLTKLPPVDAPWLVARCASDPADDVRAAACECLGAMRFADARNVLEHCLHDKVWFVRLQAVRALARISGPACLPQLLARVAREKSGPVLESIKNVLVSDPANTLRATEELLERAAPRVQDWIVNALVDSNSVVKLLAQCLAGPERERALRLLNRLVQSQLHFGLKEALAQFQPDARRRLLDLVSSLDAGLAQRMEPQVAGGP